jgi:hypothetical protein
MIASRNCALGVGSRVGSVTAAGGSVEIAVAALVVFSTVLVMLLASRGCGPRRRRM